MPTTLLKVANAMLESTVKTQTLECNSYMQEEYNRSQYSGRLYITNSNSSQIQAIIMFLEAPQCQRRLPFYGNFPETTSTVQLARAGARVLPTCLITN